MSLLPDERTAVRVGGIALAVGLAAVVFVAVIAPRLSLGRAVRVRVLYAELAGLREGAVVRSAGAAIGRVEAISWSPAGASPLLRGDAGAVVHLALKPKLVERAWADGEYIISSRGPLSARFVEILPPRGGASGGPVADGAVLRGVDPPTMDRVLQRTWTNLLIAKRFLDEVRPEAATLRAALAELAETWRQLRPAAAGAGSAQRAAAALGELIDEAERAWGEVLGGRAGVDAMAALAPRAAALQAALVRRTGQLADALAPLRADLAALRARVDHAAPGARLAELVLRGEALAGQLAALERSAREVWRRWQLHEGTLGRLLYDPEFPEDAKELGKILKRQPWRIVGHPEDGRAP
ncbi:MAG: MlaD family protein [Kofleriaceae bacterium]